MKKHLAVFAALMLAVSLFLLPGSALGDAGNFSGGSDYGGSSSSGSSGGGWSSSSSDWGSSSSSSYGSSTSSGSGDDIPFGCVVTIVVLFAIVALVFARSGMLIRSKNNAPSVGPLPQMGSQHPELKSFADLLVKDPSFNAEALATKVANIYPQMQNAWTAKDFTPMRPYFSDELYTQFDRQLDAYRQQHQTNYVDRIAVLGVELQGWYETDANDCIVALVNTRIVDYVLDDNTGALVSGSQSDEKFMTYEYTLIRSKGSVTASQTGEVEAMNCPNCGAALDINATTKCPYCGSIVSAKDFDWVISQIKGIAQRTGN